MLRIINKETKEVIESGFPNNCTLDEAINMVGRIVTDANSPDFDEDGENVIIFGQPYFYEDLDLEAYNPEDQRYTVFWIGGKRDGETLATFDEEIDAMNFAREFSAEHEDEFDPCFGGVGIVDPDGNAVMDW